MESSRLVEQFDEQMIEIYRRAKSEADYTPSLFLKMISEKGGLQTAKELIRRENVSDGYTQLCLRGRLDLTVEAVVYNNPKWHSLFTVEDLAICKSRCEQLNLH